VFYFECLVQKEDMKICNNKCKLF